MKILSILCPVLVAAATLIVMIQVLKRRRKSEDVTETYMCEGMTLGLCLGAALGVSSFVNISYFISIGMLIGFIVGLQLRK